MRNQFNCSIEHFLLFLWFLFSDNIIGLVNIRDFALLDTESGKFTVRSLMNFYNHRYGKEIMPDDSCYDVFNKLKKGIENTLLHFHCD